jgi:hypothetical protein
MRPIDLLPFCPERSERLQIVKFSYGVGVSVRPTHAALLAGGSKKGMVESYSSVPLRC